ncbi:hypothetical protein [Sutcliffiella cohnii]|uniref:hypothetical protein n=1 Tax=Sutcliffiella cohnii TaxID=33932 RepID=UPI000AA9FC1B|nr:hypothetical protein [Sutcliffiella cohnii]
MELTIKKNGNRPQEVTVDGKVYLFGPHVTERQIKRVLPSVMGRVKKGDRS